MPTVCFETAFSTHKTELGLDLCLNHSLFFLHFPFILVSKLSDPAKEILDQVDVFIFDCDGVIWRVSFIFRRYICFIIYTLFAKIITSYRTFLLTIELTTYLHNYLNRAIP